MFLFLSLSDEGSLASYLIPLPQIQTCIGFVCNTLWSYTVPRGVALRLIQLNSSMSLPGVSQLEVPLGFLQKPYLQFRKHISPYLAHRSLEIVHRKKMMNTSVLLSPCHHFYAKFWWFVVVVFSFHGIWHSVFKNGTKKGLAPLIVWKAPSSCLVCPACFSVLSHGCDTSITLLDRDLQASQEKKK